MGVRLKPAKMIMVMAAAVLAPMACSSVEATGPDEVPGTLRVGIIPNISPEKQQAQYEPFRKYLAGRLHVTVQLFVATDYAGVVAALVAKKVDVAYVGGLTYVQAAAQSKVVPLVTEIDTETGTTRYPSAIVVRANSPHTRLRDVVAAGGRFAFGDPSSTSGSLYPRLMLIDAGARCDSVELSKCPPLTSVVFTGGHDASAQAVLNGSVDAAGLELRILHRLERQGTVKSGALRIIETRDVMGYPWVAREGLAEQACKTISDAFVAITDTTLLELMRAKGYEPVVDADYAEVRDAATRLGLLTVRK